MQYAIFQAYLKPQIDWLSKRIQKLQQELTKNPVTALQERGWNATAAAARSAVYTEVLDQVEGAMEQPCTGPNIEVSASVADFILTKVVDHGRYPRQCAETASELLHREEGIAWAEIYSTLVSGRPGGAITKKSS